MGVHTTSTNAACGCEDNGDNPGVEFQQNNKLADISFTVTDNDGQPLTEAQVAILVNGVTLIVSEIQTPVVIAVVVLGTMPVRKYIYLFRPGKGKWGHGGTPVTEDHIFFFCPQNATPADVASSGNTEVIELGTINTADYLPAANSDDRDLSNPDLVYFFRYSYDGHTYMVYFKGPNGFYGGSYPTMLTSANFEAGPDTTAPAIYIPNANQVMAAGSTITDQTTAWLDTETGNFIDVDGRGIESKQAVGKKARIEFEALPADNPETVTHTVPAKPADDTFAMVSDIEALPKDLPKDFFLSTLSQSVSPKTLMYKTDEYRYLDLSSYLPASIDFGWVDYIDNDIFIQGRSYIEGEDKFYLLALRNCKIIKNVLTVGTYQFQLLEGVTITGVTSARLHGSVLHRGFFYLCTRTSSSTIATQVVKANLYDLSDYEVVAVPFLGATTYITAYKNKLYMLMTSGVSASNAFVSYFIRVDENLTNFEKINIAGTESVGRRIYQNTPFVIYNDEAYIPTVNASSDITRNQTGVIVCDMNTLQIKREVTGLDVSTGAVYPSNPIPHWISVFNGKLIYHTTGTTEANKLLIRINAATLSLEESIPLTNQFTNDNTITRYGEIWLNGEGSATAGLWTCKYDDFTTFQKVIENYSSTGTPPNKVEKEKQKIYLTDFKDDLTFKTVNGQSIRGEGDITGSGIASVAGAAGEIIVTNGTVAPVISIDPLYTAAVHSTVPKVVASKAGLSDSVIGSVDGTTEKILAVITVPANTVSKGMLRLDLSTMVSATGLASTKSIRIKTNTSNTLTGASTIASGTVAATSRYAPFERTKLDFTGSVIRSTGLTALTDTAVSTAAISSVSFNPAVTNYIFITGQLASAADDITLMSFSIVNNKEI